MVHGIISLKCEKGHTLPIAYDDNNCGCHSDGKPCLILSCEKCNREIDTSKPIDEIDWPGFIRIPLDEETNKQVLKLLGVGKN